MLVEARRRGAEVEIIVPGPVLDAQIVRRASRAMWGPLLEAGVRIYEYQPTMYHTKVMVVDDIWVSVGSTNFDDRSFRRRSREVTLEAWRARPLWERLQERWASIVRSQL
jgi:cardiolipin synthase